MFDEDGDVVVDDDDDDDDVLLSLLRATYCYSVAAATADDGDND